MYVNDHAHALHHRLVHSLQDAMGQQVHEIMAAAVVPCVRQQLPHDHPRRQHLPTTIANDNEDNNDTRSWFARWSPSTSVPPRF